MVCTEDGAHRLAASLWRGVLEQNNERCCWFQKHPWTVFLLCLLSQQAFQGAPDIDITSIAVSLH